ncbi:cytochrome P450 [Saccharothrix texasensis]|uniref:Cytochrome P450 n=1 Tax=Saccharothrix texasensis TaxID=103734 RepID=A0A3N1H050_9PSEU|nr:cytochrome P450 [Saccharothrix texasensis]ROP35849.1 cytochrome P450 [Saccharothrix texasensis]
MSTARAPRAPGWLPLLGHTIPLLSQRTKFTSSLHRYGDIVEVHIGSQPGYVLTDKALVHEVLVADAGNYERGRVFDKLRPFMGNGLVTSTGRQHRRQRRLMQPAFHRREIAGYVTSMSKAATEMVDSWRAGEARPIDDDMHVVAGTVVAKALFSESLDTPALREFLRCNRILVAHSTVRAMSPAVIGALPLPVNRRFDRAVEHVRRAVREVVTERRAHPDEHSDLLSMLLAARDEDTAEGMTDDEVHDEMITLFVAGVETASRALAWAFHEIGRRPDVESRLLAEVDEVLEGGPAGIEDVPRLTYTRQVVNEVLRFYGPWLLMRRPTTDVELGGVRLAAGTELIVSPHALHHDPRSFPDPDRFDPDRWLPERAAEVPRHAYIPFAAGVHQCIGSAFALAEITVVIATVLSRVRLEPVPGKPVRELVTNVPVPSQLPMTVVPRTPGEA